ncbi:hypothetical protein CHUAL_012080, partial [Chamberlinius hualienensis]
MVNGIQKHFIEESAIGSGDCFFDSVAQALNQKITKTKKVTSKDLRQICQMICQNLPNEDKEWLKNALKLEDYNTIGEYAARVGYTATDLEDYPAIASVLNLSSPIWGRPEIEGRMICQYYNVQIHLLERQIVNRNGVWVNQLINQNGSKSVDEVNWDDEKLIHILNEGNLHFIPLLCVDIQQNGAEGPDTVPRSNSMLMNNWEMPNSENVDIEHNSPIVDVQLNSQPRLEDQDQVRRATSKLHNNSEKSPKKFEMVEDENEKDVSNQLLLNKDGPSSLSNEIIQHQMTSNKDENIIRKQPIEYQPSSNKRQKLNSNEKLTEWPMSKVMNSENTMIKKRLKPNSNEAITKLPNAKVINKVNHVISKQQEGADKGDMYEIYLIMLMFTRGPLLKCNYEVGHEIKAADKFNEVVFRYKNENSWKYRFFQTKHINNLNNQIMFSDLFIKKRKKDDRDFKDYFDVAKYFSSYEDILFEFKNGSFEGGELEDLIIFTNAGIDINDLERNYIKLEQLDKQSNELLYIPNTKYYKLTISDENSIKTLVNSANIHKLAKKLVEYALSSNSKKNTSSVEPNVISNTDDIVVKYYYWLKKEEILEFDEKQLVIKFKSTFLNSENALEDVKQFKELILKYYREITKTHAPIIIIKENLLKGKIRIPKRILDKIDKRIRAPNTHMAKEEGVNEFLSKLILAVNQPSADDIEKYILDKNTTTKLNIFNDEVVVLGVKHEILLWLRKKKNKEGWINGTNSSSIIHETNAIAQILVINDPFE